MPRCSAFPEKYSHTPLSMDTGISTWALGGNVVKPANFFAEVDFGGHVVVSAGGLFIAPLAFSHWRKPAGIPQPADWWHDGSMPKSPTGFSLAIEYFREEDGRWLADIAALPGVTAYGRTRKQATAAVQALALRLIADRLEHGEAVPGPMNVSFIAA